MSELAKKFHDTYERLAPQFGYETRPGTKQFDPDSPNGRLMIAVCKEVAGDRIEELEARWNYIKTDIDGARSLLLLLSIGKGSARDFDTMIDRIIESREQAANRSDGA